MKDDESEALSWRLRVEAAKAVWTELSPDDFELMEATLEALSTLIQERYGESKESIEAKLNTIYL